MSVFLSTIQDMLVIRWRAIVRVYLLGRSVLV
jgi:hypothetical protein